MIKTQYIEWFSSHISEIGDRRATALSTGVESDSYPSTFPLMTHHFRRKSLMPRRFPPSIESPGVPILPWSRFQSWRQFGDGRAPATGEADRREVFEYSSCKGVQLRVLSLAPMIVKAVALFRKGPPTKNEMRGHTQIGSTRTGSRSTAKSRNWRTRAGIERFSTTNARNGASGIGSSGRTGTNNPS